VATVTGAFSLTELNHTRVSNKLLAGNPNHSYANTSIDDICYVVRRYVAYRVGMVNAQKNVVLIREETKPFGRTRHTWKDIINPLSPSGYYMYHLL
jgi:hypothetical protein